MEQQGECFLYTPHHIPTECGPQTKQSPQKKTPHSLGVSFESFHLSLLGCTMLGSGFRHIFPTTPELMGVERGV